MADSKRQQIVDAINAALKTVKTTAGYETNLGNNIFEWRSEPFQQSELPGAIWRDQDTTVRLSFGAHDHEMTLEIEIVAGGSDAPKTYRKAIADVVKLVGANRTWGNLAQDTEPGEETLNVEKESKRIISATVTFNIIFTTLQFDPYN